MKSGGNDDLRAREILREWRRRGVESIRIHITERAGMIAWSCWPHSMDQEVAEGFVYSMPDVIELPELESETAPGCPISDAELFMAAAISEDWNDPTVPGSPSPLSLNAAT